MSTPKLPRAPNRTTPGFAFSILDRVLREHMAKRRFGKSEQGQVLEFFKSEGLTCVFCGTPEVRRWDHLVPVKSGGDTVPGNMVLSCGPCDDSKQHHPFEKWLLGSSPSGPRQKGVQDLDRRVQLLRDYMARFNYRPGTGEESLTSAELTELSGIRAEAVRLRAMVQAFTDRQSNRRKQGATPPG